MKLPKDLNGITALAWQNYIPVPLLAVSRPAVVSAKA